MSCHNGSQSNFGERIIANKASMKNLALSVKIMNRISKPKQTRLEKWKQEYQARTHTESRRRYSMLKTTTKRTFKPIKMVLKTGKL